MNNKKYILTALLITIAFITSACTSNINNNEVTDNTTEQNIEDISNNTTNEEYIAESEEVKEEYTAPKNCLYETSDGVCFTTIAFKPEPLNYYECTGGLTTYRQKEPATSELAKIGIKNCYSHYDYWAGAMKQCHDWGFRLPNEYELTSLAQDIYGVKVSRKENIMSSLPDGHKINTIPIKQLYLYIRAFSVHYWENGEIEEDKAYSRHFENTYTERRPGRRGDEVYFDHFINAICVYDPNGIAKDNYKEFEQKRIK